MKKYQQNITIDSKSVICVGDGDVGKTAFFQTATGKDIDWEWGCSAEFLQKMCRFFTEKLHFFYRKCTFSVKKNYRKRTFSVKNL